MKPVGTQVVVALLLGGVVGFGIAQWRATAGFHQRWEHGHGQAELLQRFGSKLRLTTEQHARVAAILEAKRQKIDALRAEIHPKFDQIRQETRTEIRQLLTPEQQRTFDAMTAEWESRRKDMRDHWRER